MLNKTLTVASILVVMATVFVCANIAQAQGVITNGLVSYWDFDHITGNTVKDMWGKNDGTIMGNPKVVKGRIGQALEFNGIDDYVDTNGQDDFKFGTGDYTVSLWMNPYVWAGYTAPISNSVYNNGWDGFHFEQEDWVGSPGQINSIRWLAGNDWVNSDIVLSVNTLYHLVGVREAGTLHVYIDGVIKGSGSAPSDVNVDRNLMIARNPDTTYPRNFNGIIDEVAIYNRALSEGEVMQLFTSEGSAAVKATGKLACTWGEIKSW